MARTLSQALTEEKNKMHTSFSWLIFLDITLNDDDSTEYHLVRDQSNITFRGQEYTAFSFDIEPVDYSSRGNIPTLSIKVSNITRLLQPLLDDVNGGIGSTVKITVVNSRYLNDDYSDFEETYDVLETSVDARWVNFILGGPSLLRQRLPLYKYLALHCRWVFRGEECKYAGALTTCLRTYEQCRERNNVTNFGGFPGMKSGGLKIA
jgi:lambda family phage minor tail protein L